MRLSNVSLVFAEETEEGGRKAEKKEEAAVVTDAADDETRWRSEMVVEDLAVLKTAEEKLLLNNTKTKRYI